MKCYQCGEPTTIRKEKTYHYTESGLTNVYLTNVEIMMCKSCGAEMLRLTHLEALHAAIARAIVLQPTPLSGTEVRFLRKHLGLKAREWATLLRVDTTTLSRWEQGEQPTGPQSDSLIRLLYLRLLEEREETFAGDRVTERLAVVDKEAIEPPTVLIDMDNPTVYTYQP